ncbi:MAG: hypothetical protein H7Z21_16165 [Hymenobacter sp.]|nr:hypothetical protein [Hymenobacter sp.]
MSQNMNAYYYRAIFGKTQLTQADLVTFDVGESNRPPADLASTQLAYHDFSADTAATAEQSWDGPSYRVDARHVYSPGYMGLLTTIGAQPNESWILVRLLAFFPEKEWDFGRAQGVAIDFQRGNKSYAWKSVRLMNKVGEISTLWGGSAGVWGKVEFALKVPRDAQPTDELRVYVHNGNADKPVYIDNLEVRHLHP